jgi:hypothetical protein
MDHRIALDQTLSNRVKFGEKATPIALILNTWRGTIENEANLPEDWTSIDGVLVSIRPKRPAGRNR